MKTLELGLSTQGRVLRVAQFGSQPWVLVLGGVHGDEVEGVWLCQSLLNEWNKSFLFTNVGVLLWSEVNPDGVAANQRGNCRQVDLNRNLPTKDWTAEIKNPRYCPGPFPGSEPENQALIGLIDTHKPVAILSLHSFKDFQVNANGPAHEWAACLAATSGYRVTDDIGYPTPGSLGTYAGKERQIPTITLEIERGLPQERVLDLHLPTVTAAIRYWDRKLQK